LTNEWGQRLAELSVRLIEEPGYRLAGTEEAIRQTVATIEQVLQHHEPLAKDLAAKATEAHGRLKALTAPPQKGVRRYSLEPVDVVELLRCYPKWRFQSLMLQQVAAAYVCLRGHLSDELREVNYCRIRLGELSRMLEDPPGDKGLSAADTTRLLFPSGCRSLSEAIERFLGAVSAEAMHELETAVQATISSRFHSLVNICLTDAGILKNVEAAIMQTAREFVTRNLPPTNVAELFFNEHPDEDNATRELEGYCTEAAPELAPGHVSRVSEVCVLATPSGPAGDKLRELAREAMPETEQHPAVSTDDVVIYRELTNLPLAELDILGPQGQDAYRQMSNAENFTPHSRIDVDFGSHQGL
jgi:hypothetical protein